MTVQIPKVPLPPILIFPNLAKGTENVTMFGVMLRITITSAGLAGTSFEDILNGFPNNFLGKKTSYFQGE